MDDKLNRKAIKGKYYKDIEEGIKEKYKELYKDEIIIEYKFEKSKYYFTINLKGKTFNKKGIVIDTLIFIDKFVNLDAINMFAKNYSLQEFDKEFNDYSEENYKILKEEINKIVEEYKEAGVLFQTVSINNSFMYIEYHHPNYKRPFAQFNIKSYRKHFAVTPISTLTMKNTVKDFKNHMHRFITDCILKTIDNE